VDARRSKLTITSRPRPTQHSRPQSPLPLPPDLAWPVGVLVESRCHPDRPLLHTATAQHVGDMLAHRRTQFLPESRGEGRGGGGRAEQQTQSTATRKWEYHTTPGVAGVRAKLEEPTFSGARQAQAVARRSRRRQEDDDEQTPPSIKATRPQGSVVKNMHPS
jgi:hypothetical protein